MSEYGRFDLRYVRTDKNGTKIYHDINCPRCCGYGELEQWAYTGRVCFACGGTGQRSKPKVVKIYTPEYAEKLEQRRIARLDQTGGWQVEHLHAGFYLPGETRTRRRESSGSKCSGHVQCVRVCGS